MRRAVVLMGAALLALQVMPMEPTALAAPLPRPSATVRSGFIDSLVTGATSAPVAVSALPDGRAVVLEKGGVARVIRNGALVAAPALTLSVCSDSERGLLGFAPDPHFGFNGFVYVYYTRANASAPGGCVNRVSRFTMSGDRIARSSELVLLDNIGSPAGNHNGGDVAIGNDGYLYVSVGDGGCDARNDSGCAGANNAAQDLSLLNGKILRVNRVTGAPAVGNPFTGAGSAICRTRGNGPSTPTTRCREIFAYGLRNPWRFAFDPNTGGTRFFIDDVGQNLREEVDLGIVGANYGWPLREGVCAQATNPPCGGPPAGITQPLTDYQHGVTGEYITGGAFVPNGSWGAGFDGGYLFADGSPGRIFFRSRSGAVNYASPFASGVGGISDMAMVMDPAGWSLYYVNPSTNEVRKIVPQRTAAAASAHLAFVPVVARRAFDSRLLGAASGPLRAGTSRLVNLVSPRGAHRAALVNISAIRPTSAVSLTVWQPRTPRPSTGNLNGARNQVTMNTAVVPVDASGNVELFTNATTNVGIDVLGYFDATTGGTATAGRFVPSGPTRVVDTRRAAGVGANVYTRTPAGSQTVVNVPLAGRAGVVSGARAVALMVTAVAAPSASSGAVTAYPSGAAVPGVASLATNGSSDVRSNLVVVPLGTGGSVDLRLRGVAHVTVDVVGSFTGASAARSAVGTYVSAPARRVVDTRRSLGFSRLAAGGIGSTNPSVVPDTALAVTQNVAMVAPSKAGVAVAYRHQVAVPLATTVAVTAAGQTRSAATFTSLRLGRERVRSSVATDIVVDVTGWFVG